MKNDVDKCFKRWQKNVDDERKSTLKRKQEVWETIEKVVKILVDTDPGIKKVILFGSIVENEDRFNLNSDIDIAVTCSKDKYYILVSRMLDVPDIKVDLLDLEKTGGFLRERIIEKGVILYER
ncbi:MAG: nucleotidyltransferase domain-containing protein [bacterium]|nr:nucleotidyltransferase domain-containing protein [bacterium]